MTGKCWCDCEQKMMDPTMCGGCLVLLDNIDPLMIAAGRAMAPQVNEMLAILQAQIDTPDKEG